MIFFVILRRKSEPVAVWVAADGLSLQENSATTVYNP